MIALRFLARIWTAEGEVHRPAMISRKSTAFQTSRHLPSRSLRGRLDVVAEVNLDSMLVTMGEDAALLID